MSGSRIILKNISKGQGKLVGPVGSFSIYHEDRPSCIIGCPAGVDIKAYVNLISDKRYEDAVSIIRLTNPFPGICGRVCTHPCEAECGRKDIDESVSIKTLKRFAADYELSRKSQMKESPKKHEKSVAIIGSGPAGLTAAVDLTLAGFPVTVFEEGKEPGGLLAWGIPDFRLPKNIVRSEIKDMVNLGVEICTNERVDNPLELLEEGYSAIILAMGCQAPVKLDIEGHENLTDCLEFLRNVSDGKLAKLPGKTIVIGGGNAALDSARTALRLGGETIIAYRRTEEQMPAEAEEIHHAKEEGINFQFLAIPHRVLTHGKKITGMEFQRAELGEPDDSGRCSPVPIPDDYFTIEADNVILALGSNTDTSSLPDTLKLTKWSTLETDEWNMTSQQGLFAAGDIVSGPSTIVDAIGSGHCAANGVMNFLIGEEGDFGARTSEMMLIVESEVPDAEKRVEAVCIPANKRQTTFDEVEMGLEEANALAEANRCRRCGSCSVCSVCLSVCDYRNAVITILDADESALAKIPFQLAEKGMGQDWKIQIDNEEFAVKIEPIMARVDETLCIACGRCEESCPYKAIRTVFDMLGNAHAQIDASACRGCGACAGTCPSGAIKMGYVDNDDLFPKIHEAVKESDIVKLSCIWNDFDSGIACEPGEIKLQCTRRASPSLILEALASGARGIEIFGCNNDECHYLPGPWMGPDIVESCKLILQELGIDPGRIVYSNMNNLQTIPEGREKFLPFVQNIPDTKTPMGRCLNAAQILMAQPDIKFQPEANGKYLLGMGCLAMSEPTFLAHGFERPDILGSIMKLLEIAGIEYELAQGIHISGNSLKEWGMESLFEQYSKSIINQVKSSQAECLIIPTPKTYKAFIEEYGEVFGVLSLPEMLKGLQGKLAPTNLTVGYHPSCVDGGDFDASCLELLALIPGLKVVELQGECGDTGWRSVGSDSRKKGAELMRKADEAGAKILISSSTRCTAHLDALRNGWCQSGVDVQDIFSFLVSRLEVIDNE